MAHRPLLRRNAPRALAACALAALACVPFASARSADRIPCSGPDGGAAALIAAINTANAAGGGTIRLAEDCTYRLVAADNHNPAFGDNGLPVITGEITLRGDDTTIAGNSTSFRILQVGAAGDLTLRGLTITGGNVQGPGGGILNLEGAVTLVESSVTGNRSAAGGGGIASGTGNTGPLGTLTLRDSSVTHNVTDGGGGGILNRAGTATLKDSEVTDNTGFGGGGIASGTGSGGTAGASLLTLDDSVVARNTVTGGVFSGGGGIVNGGTLVVNRSEITANSAPGGFGAGIFNHGVSATLDRSEVTGNVAGTDASGSSGFGGGIANVDFGIPGAPSPTLTLNRTEVSHNVATGAGGGIFGLGGTVILNRSEVEDNTPDNCSPPIEGCSG